MVINFTIRRVVHPIRTFDSLMTSLKGVQYSIHSSKKGD